MEAALAAVVGDDAPLIAELRTAFFDSARGHFAGLRTATTAEAWLHSANRLRGLAASFGAMRIIDAASAAAAALPGDVRALQRVERALLALAGESH